MKIFKFNLGSNGRKYEIRAKDEDILEVVLLRNRIDPSKVNDVECQYLNRYETLFQLEMDTHTTWFGKMKLEKQIEHYKKIDKLMNNI